MGSSQPISMHFEVCGSANSRRFATDKTRRTRNPLGGDEQKFESSGDEQYVQFGRKDINIPLPFHPGPFGR